MTKLRGFLPGGVLAGTLLLIALSPSRPALILFTDPSRPLDAELRAALRDHAPDQVLPSATHQTRFQACVGEPGAVALAVVAADGTPIAAKTADLEPAAVARFLRRAKAGARLRDLPLARLQLEVLSLPLARATLLALPDTAPRRALLARTHALLGEADKARRLGPLDALTEALCCVIELQAAAALARVDAAAGEPDLALLVRADALHVGRRCADAVVALEHLLANHPDSAFVPWARARLDHLRSPNHGHDH